MSLGGWGFSALSPQVNESLHNGELPEDYVLRLARSKARAVLDILEIPPSPDLLIVAADTTVVDTSVSDNPGMQNSGVGVNVASSKRSEILGKPADDAEAESMLRRLRGRVHQVYTAIVVLRPADGDLRDQLVVSDVQMRDYSDAEMRGYISSGDPLDKAGAYAIQNPVFKPVERLSGCYANVMGLPVCHLARLLADFGEGFDANLAQACMGTLDYPCPIFRQALGLRE